MTTKAPLTTAARCRYLVLVGALGAFLPCLHAQSAPAPTAAQLAKYDKNKNNVLDPDELAAMQADLAREETLVLTPFTVSTDKDRGYSAGNTLSGGRADTPLKITAASISVMTKEFMDDFAITDMNQAAAWTIGMDPPTGGEAGPFGGNRYQANFRGAGNGANYPSRNGALEYFVADSYNTERLEFSRGPNAALFGDAGPGGVQGSSSKIARFNNRQSSLSFRGDSYGGYRATLDTSYGLDKVAVRFNALRQNTKAYQDGTGNFQQAFTLDVSYRIAKNTQIRAEYNHSHEWNVQYRRTYQENASLWNRTTFNDNNTTLTTTGTGLSTYGSATSDRLVWNFGTNSLINYRGVQYQTNGLGYAIPWHGRPEFTNFLPGISKSFFLGPGDVIAARDLNSRNITVDHRFTPDLFFQTSFISSDIDPTQINTANPPGDYRIDVNRLLPNGTPNPNFGKAYSEASDSRQYQANNVTEFRFITTYQFEAPKLFQMHQRFSLNGGWRQDLYEAWQRAWRRVDNPTVPDPTNSQNTLNYRIYYDQPRPNVHPIFTDNIGGMQFANVATGFAADNNRRLYYGQLVSQTSFFDERVGVTMSFRRDKNMDDVSGNIGFLTVAPYSLIMGAQNPKTLVNEAGRRGRLDTFRNSQNAGIVAYPFPASWGRWVSPIGIVANYSQNFSIPSTGAPLFSGQRPAPPVATTKDWGLRYSMPNGLAYATLSHYATSQTGNIINLPGTTTSGFQSIWTNLGYTDADHTSGFAYRDTQDRKLEGWEVELTANPTRNLTFTMNYSHPIVTTISDSPGTRGYYAANLPEFTAGSKAAPGAVLNGHTIIDPVAIANSIQTIENNFNGFTPGTLANNLERHRVNVAGAYQFTEGALRGFRFNAGVNYRAHRKVASVDPIIKFGLQRAATVTETAQAAYDYLWVQPTWSETLGANYTHRFGKYSARFQINIDNPFNDDKPQWSSYSTINAGQLNNNSTGNVFSVAGGNNRMQVRSGFVQLDPRKITFSTTVNF